ncbi:MAG: DUF1302 domain-containing protein, partial [Gammaproteobacteria bacterium]|nr:DUF1302 domain-containing protein [Gammaproteobacteria bacterium]
DGYRGDWSFSGLIIPEIRFNKTAPFGSDFYAFPGPQPDEIEPADGGSNTEYALAANGIFSGWDLAFYAARIFNDRPHQETRAGITTRRHSRLSMVGAAVNIALGNWLFKGEAARFSGLEFTGLPGKTKSRSDLLLGVEYSGITDATLSLELVNRHQHGHESLLATAGVKKNEVQTALRFQRDFLHDRLHLTYLGSFFEWGKDGGFTRVSLAYDLEDALTVSGGTVIYHHGEKPPFNTIGDNDRVFLDLKYSF